MRRSLLTLTRFALLACVLTFVAAVSWAELPSGQHVDQGETCLGCHDLEDAMGAEFKHSPVVNAECTACHNPHVSRFSALLRERPGPLCASCHGEIQAELTREIVHRPAAEGKCADCHQPHGSGHRGLLKEGSQELCATCHQQVSAWKEQRIQHPPFAQGRCAGCHEPHGSDNQGLVIRSGAGICTSCHQTDDSFRRAHNNYPVQNASCHQCHDPHASAKAGLFKETTHEPFATGNCTTCHRGAGAADPFALVMPVDELCGECHEDQVAASRETAFPHVSAGGGNCVTCHNPHSGDSGLLQQDQLSLCTDCHDPGGAKSGESGRFLTHAGQFDCSTCHRPHGGERPLLFVNDMIDLCDQCHRHEHEIRHPMGEDIRDPRTGSAMDCSSCHSLHDGPHEYFLHASKQRDLCVGCHKDVGGGN